MSDSILSPEKISRRFQEIVQKSYLPAQLLSIIKTVLELDANSQDQVKISLKKDAKEKLSDKIKCSQGVALLPKEYFPLDQKHAEKMAKEILVAISKIDKELDQGLLSAIKELEEKVNKKELSWNTAFEAILKDDQKFFKTWAEKLPQAPALVRFIAMSAIMPSLFKIKALLVEILKENTEQTGIVWTHGHCPLCGSLPFLSRLVKKEGFLYDSCSFCQHEYRVKRLQCPFCLNDNTESLKQYSVDEEPKYQIHACKECNNYIKQADYRERFDDFIASLDDLDSLALDILAKRMGYTRPTLSSWGF
ncbi:formate dehydrogenase accessory protein FdhE [Desulfovibrio litoralis]|uniref:FdhE protein n=1 Tax=Desulfovibrio litoralis DSM 11393 TaxID=1121455 RepID=A0A1M7RVB5_9BACT|nr:formate dehydrogenase accessory protein FdhE [Desulfovibrio litoralis]SHN50114.1 FdhE protein [Desulfovibrio litoralis DSM 11393]